MVSCWVVSANTHFVSRCLLYGNNFLLDSPQSLTATCNVCKAVVPRGGRSVATFNTTNLIKHLQKHHPKEHDEFLAMKGLKAQTSRQESLLQSFERQGKLSPDNVKAKEITEKVLNFIVLDDQPLSVVENEGFRSLMEYLQPRYSLPSRRYLSETALPELYNQVSTKLADKLKGVPNLSFTTDIWTSDVSPMSLISLTVHWIDRDTYGLCCAVLQVKKCGGSHNRATIAASITEMLNHWGIPLEKVHVILRDNASNMKAAMQDLSVSNLGCFAHSLQLVVNEGLISQRSVSDALANSRKIVAHFKHSQLAQSRLEDLQREMQGAGTTTSPSRLVQDVQTRWNSSFYMIKSILKEKRPLCAYAADHNLPATLSANDWALLEKTAAVLEPFEELTRKISSATSTAAEVIPAVTVLQRLLAENTSTGIKTMKTTLLQAVNRRFSNIESEPLYAVATLVDARYKDRFFTSGDAARRGKALLIQELEKVEQALTDEAGTTVAEPAKKMACMEAGPSTGVPPGTTKSSFSSLYDKSLEEHDEPAGGTQAVVTQMQMFLKEPTIGEADSPFQYWANHHARFPLLAAVATKFLSAPSTSVESERLFSTASNIVDEKRNRLTAERAEMLIFLKKNLPMFK
ncbi:zinc finger BED domain-containing protein 4-like [Astyanax mexicanus]|uniref:Zinc finger BED domain-containing protein 4-like n=1 Tax=Astyanax mexicanus TaxID=7994 RepID=A0A8T2KUC8_ASTMX|nr:zinc finger BED domain-containing protein 4-like [Astyanax mexicanus]